MNSFNLLQWASALFGFITVLITIFLIVFRKQLLDIIGGAISTSINTKITEEIKMKYSIELENYKKELDIEKQLSINFIGNDLTNKKILYSELDKIKVLIVLAWYDATKENVDNLFDKIDKFGVIQKEMEFETDDTLLTELKSLLFHVRKFGMMKQEIISIREMEEEVIKEVLNNYINANEKIKDTILEKIEAFKIQFKTEYEYYKKFKES